MAFYSNSGSGELKRQKGEPREVTCRKPIMRKLITKALVAVYSFTSTIFDKTGEMSALVSFNLNTGIYFFPCLFVFFLVFNEHLYCEKCLPE